MLRPSKIASAAALVAVLLTSATLSSCRSNSEPDDAAALLEKVKGESYTTWDRAPGFPTRKASDAPHGDLVDIYVNPVVADTLASGAKVTAWPDGSIIVKDGWDEDGERVLTSILEKRGAEWFWAEYDEEDEPIYSGSPGLCRACHEEGADFVRAFPFP